MSFWGETATKPLEPGWRPVRRAAFVKAEGTAFVPVVSHVAAVQTLVAALEQGSRGVVIHGPAGSGRTVVSRQICRVAGGQVHELTQPPLDFDGFTSGKHGIVQDFSGQKRPGFIRVDGLTLEHRGWEALGSGFAVPGVRPVLVATTAWWLWHRRHFGRDWAEVGLKLLQRDEIEHLANASRWRLDPRHSQLGEAAIEEIERKSQGLATVVSRLALAEFFH